MKTPQDIYIEDLTKLADCVITADMIAGYLPEGPQKVCTCGAHKTYGKDCSGHSEWCDLYEKV